MFGSLSVPTVDHILRRPDRSGSAQARPPGYWRQRNVGHLQAKPVDGLCEIRVITLCFHVLLWAS
jgi:hypothetical protein